MQSGSGLLQDADRRGQNPSAVRAGSLLLLHLLFLTLASAPASALAALEPLARPCGGTLQFPMSRWSGDACGVSCDYEESLEKWE